jgi:hypothetical protein
LILFTTDRVLLPDAGQSVPDQEELRLQALQQHMLPLQRQNERPEMDHRFPRDE